MGKIVIVGSINIDLVTKSNRFPQIGETIIGDSFKKLPGGKGANQAVCCGKLGADVGIIGCVGNDEYSKFLLQNFKSNNVDTSGVEILKGIETGIAQITVTDEDNAIIVVSGANKEVSKNVINKYIDIIYGADIVVLQLEIPLDTVRYVVDICYKRGIKTILNPAPACKLDEKLINQVNYLTPNEIELEEIFGESRDIVLRKYPNKVIMTCGKDGVFYHDGKEIVNVKAKKVKVVDTTGAGDSFNGGLAYALVNNYSTKEAIEFANYVASYTVQNFGAQSAMPKINDIKK